ncbi:MAG: lipopolysaccharide biosynthesis protein [Pleurocapsa sp.]
MIINKFQKFTSGRFIRNVGWLGMSELGNRIFRLGTTVTLARMFSPDEYGLMAVIYTTFEFALVFLLNSGFSAVIIQSKEKDLKVICNTAFWLNLFLCTAITIGQCIASFFIADFYESDRLILPLCLSSLVYLTYPFIVINQALISRRNQLKVVAMCRLCQSIIGNLITIVLVLSGMSIWAIVWAMILSNPVWIIISWIYDSWRPPHPKSFNLQEWRKIVGFSSSIFGVELLTKLRSNLDYLIVGKFVSVTALGLYYFAFNAGIGISTNVIKSFSNAFYPHICEVKGDPRKLKTRYLDSLKKLMMVIVPFVTLQSSLAPIYVPIVFGEQWKQAIPILIVICLSAIPFSLSFFTDGLMNAVGQPKINLYFNLIYTIVFALAILAVVILVEENVIFWVAVTVLICHCVLASSFAIWSYRYVFLKKSRFLF